MKPSGWDKQLGLVSPRERAASQSDQTNTPSKNKVRNEVGLDVSHHARISQRGGEMPFFLDILFHRTSEIGIFQQQFAFGYTGLLGRQWQGRRCTEWIT